MAIKTPTINGIIRMTEFDLLRTKIKQGYMYMCLDSLNLYYDEDKLKLQERGCERINFRYQNVCYLYFNEIGTKWYIDIYYYYETMSVSPSNASFTYFIRQFC